MASHGRATFTLICGLLTGRWALMALGQVDYGLFGLIGGLIVFISMINTVLAGATGRFFAYSLGQMRKDSNEGLEGCQRWFNVALFIHVIVPVLLIVIGYPVGDYIIRNALNIPPERLEACIWVFRWTCLSAFVGMVTVPFRAMYTAKQYIAELTGYSVAQTCLYTVVLYYMVTHAGDWLVWLAVWTGIQASSVNVILMFRSLWVFSECKVRPRYMFDLARVKEFASFFGWQFLGVFGMAVRSQGVAILVNKYFSPVMNASCTVANTVAGHSQIFAREVDLAFAPAIYTACGANDADLMSKLAYRCSKFASWLVILFITPLMLEMKEVLILWLKDPPPYSAGLCVFMCLLLLTEKLVSGQNSIVVGSGKIRLQKCIIGISLIMTSVLVWIGFACSMGMYTIGWAFWLMSIVYSFGNVFVAKRVAGFPIIPWLRDVVVPLMLSWLPCAVVAYLPHYFMEMSFARVVVTSTIFIVVFLPVSWWGALRAEERAYVMSKIRERLRMPLNK